MRENNSILYNIAQQIKYFSKFIKNKTDIFNDDILKVFQKMYINQIKMKTGLDFCDIVVSNNIISNEVIWFAKKGKNNQLIHIIFIPMLVRLLYQMNTPKIREITHDVVTQNLFDSDIIDLSTEPETDQVIIQSLTNLEKRLILLYVVAEHSASHFAEYYRHKNSNWNHTKFKSLGNLITSEPNDDVEDRLYPIGDISGCLN